MQERVTEVDLFERNPNCRLSNKSASNNSNKTALSKVLLRVGRLDTDLLLLQSRCGITLLKKGKV